MTRSAVRDAIVLFRMGDFFETFYEDALVASKALELTLTSRSRDSEGGAIPMCGVPHHAVDSYIARLVERGFRVAICDQVEDPRKAKGLVRREVVRVVTPGTLTDSTYLDAREPAFLLGLAPAYAPRSTPAAAAGPSEPREAPVLEAVGAALLDLSTGEFTTAEFRGLAGRQALADEVAVLRPRELVVPAGFDLDAVLPPSARGATSVTAVEAWTFGRSRRGPC
jgi:DNA mismatch repair protein MutS